MTEQPSPTQVELLYFDGCPYYRRTLTDLVDLIVKEKLDATIRLVNVDSLEKADKLHFAGSPTVKVDGLDLEGYDGPGVMACRVYVENDRKGWPSKQLLKERLVHVGAPPLRLPKVE